jgi:Ca2+-transporting ATPase
MDTPSYAQTPRDVLAHLSVRQERGLDPDEIRIRQKKFGRNRLKTAQSRSAWSILLAQFGGLIVYLLAAAAALSFYFGDMAEGAAVVSVLVINAAIGFVTELRAVRSMEALRRLSKVQAHVRRNGATETIAAEDLVPGDLVLLEAGDVVPADLRLIDLNNLQNDESTLTGESLPVEKSLETVAIDTPLADRICMVFKGTAVTRGEALGVVVATGMNTELGKIATLAQQAGTDSSPLEKRLDRLGGHMIWATIALTAIIAASGVISGKDVVAMIKTAVALAVAAVPEGLPIVATVALARGMWRMARRNALIKHLAAVETLGATTIVMTDKTGTLTENRMTATRLHLANRVLDLHAPQNPDVRLDIAPDSPAALALRVAVLCNDARLADMPARNKAQTTLPEPAAHHGDPMEIALLQAGARIGLERDVLLKTTPEIRQESFSTRNRMMATFHRPAGALVSDDENQIFVAVKGAPESVFAHTTHLLEETGPIAFDAKAQKTWISHAQSMTNEGLRVLALAIKQVSDVNLNPYEDLTLIGLIALIDPPRGDVPDALYACHQAGVRVIMLTGDHAGTARAIAQSIGLNPPRPQTSDHSSTPEISVLEGRHVSDFDLGNPTDRQKLQAISVFARVSPETKLDLVRLHQESGAIVAMTGDGVNDAPALRQADIGIAMGGRGTEVAREAADMVLRDDAFPSIVVAMQQGRVIFANIRTFVIYLMSCNLSEILVIGLAVLSGLPLPLHPLQILYLNLVTDIFPAFALGFGNGDRSVMHRPPRPPSEPIIGIAQWTMIALYGLFITLGTLGAFGVARSLFHLGEQEALSVSFLTLALGQLWHVFNMRSARSRWLINDVTRNPFVWAALAICLVLIGLAVYLPSLSQLLRVVPPGLTGWILVIVGSLVPLVLGHPLRRLMERVFPGLFRRIDIHEQGPLTKR